MIFLILKVSDRQQLMWCFLFSPVYISCRRLCLQPRLFFSCGHRGFQLFLDCPIIMLDMFLPLRFILTSLIPSVPLGKQQR